MKCLILSATILNAFEGNIIESAVPGILLNNYNWTQIELTLGSIEKSTGTTLFVIQDGLLDLDTDTYKTFYFDKYILGL